MNRPFKAGLQVLLRHKRSNFSTTTTEAEERRFGKFFEFGIISGITGFVCLFTYPVWKRNELAKIEAQARLLALDGYMLLDMSHVVSKEEKRRAWLDIIKPHLLEHWQKVEPSLSIEEKNWPTPPRGRNLHLTSTKNLKGLPKVFSENYTPQAVLAFMVDPKLRLVHFGDQTDMKLRALISPLWALGSLLQKMGMNDERVEAFCTPRDMFELYGDDQAWHIVHLPNKEHGTLGLPWPEGAHYDAGYASLYRQGVPPVHPNNETPGSAALALHTDRSVLNLELQQRLLAMALQQLAILFYCEVPGDLTPSRGATGFYPRTHLVMLEGLRRYLNHKRRADNAYSEVDAILTWSDQTHAVRELFEPTAGCTPEPGVLRAHDLTEAGTQVLVQPTLKDGQALLALGPLVHTTMWCRELMPENNPRVILNCKIAGTKELRRGRELSVEGNPASGVRDPQKWAHVDYSAQQELINRISPQSLLYQIYVGPSSSLYEHAGNRGRGAGGPSERYLSQQQVDALADEYASLCLQAEGRKAEKKEKRKEAPLETRASLM